ncbi:MAG: hypothetical protein OXF11_07855 [Deltaproteobacteria bacterium]|nr:hypothetical protein [Deltaproteobacteria bacterium]
MPAGAHGDVAVSSGRVRDGVGAAQVLAYLNQVMGVGEYKRTAGLETFSSAPTARVAEGTSERLAGYAVRAVQLINAALPPEKRIRFSHEAAPPLAAIDDVPDGEIYIDFARWEDWNTTGKPPREIALGLCSCAEQLTRDPVTGQQTVAERRAAHVWVERDKILTARVFNPDTLEWETRILDSHVEDSATVRKVYSAQGVTAILVHEILHAMGMTHVDPGLFPESMMSDAGDREDPDGVTGHVVYPIDREALLAAYTVFRPGALPGRYVPSDGVSGVLDGSGEPPDSEGFVLGGSDYSGLSAEDLGPWDDTSFHVRGSLDLPDGPIAFGVAARNGLAQPWVSGPRPWTDLADNPLVPPTATWSGRLLGLTPDALTVGGNVNLQVHLETLNGQLTFGDLETWGAYEAPGPVGSGTTWQEGALRYEVAVDGNTFTDGGREGGTVTGAFFGAAHQAMGGTLERADLTASFAGIEQFVLPGGASTAGSTPAPTERPPLPN